jgi:hypothetical protein
MSRSLGAALPPALLARFAPAGLGARLGTGLPFVTLGADGALHPMLTSHVEWLGVDAGTLRLAIAEGSRSARNLEERGVGTLLLVEPGRSVYVKCRSAGPPRRAGGLACFTLAVADVLEDAPAEAEGAVQITGGITYAPVPRLDAPWVRAVRQVLET